MSVNRLIALTATQCKIEAAKISGRNFLGFAVIGVDAVRDDKSDVVDTRNENYYGHADIVHPFFFPKDKPDFPNGEPVFPKGEPASYDVAKTFKSMANRSRYFPDRDPNSKTWEGEPLE